MMKICNRLLPLVLKCVLLVCPLFFCCSCGYHLGSMAHPQLKSICVAEVQNDTKEPLLTGIAREQISGQFQHDNSYSLKSKEKADCILYCRITGVKTSAVTYSNATKNRENEYQPNEFQITVEAEFSVVIPGRSEPYIDKRKVSGTTKYMYNSDLQVGRYYALRQACFELAKLIVEYSTEAW